MCKEEFLEPHSLRAFLTVFLALPLRVGQAQLEALPAVGLSSYDLGSSGFLLLGSRVESVLRVSWPLLGGSWVVISRVISPLIGAISDNYSYPTYNPTYNYP